ncbi:MAG: tRNA preQ1(34) S-adenosylmethionine ribosyltransferase-isomerase QueA [Bacilli bacterium]|jgi:S-adenosylmethionine:tRNA ribosyltransferase-isomerase|nr:tRNA preQ1(34) S-adenosylmethionine ribosyltransferase-isomerase QueA [Bacilli bacterium]
MNTPGFDYDIYSLSSYDYYLPKEQIAQSPAEQRDHSRCLMMDRFTGELQDLPYFYQIEDYLKPGDVLVRNNTKVIPARLVGEKKETHAHVELLLLNEKKDQKDVWECLVGNAHAVKLGTVVSFGTNDELVATCVGVEEEGLRLMKMDYKGIFLEVLDALGEMPLPPYIHEQLGDNSRYQTVYAKIEGSAAAPTAGFHFTKELFEKLKKKGVEVVDITLHIGLGTFRPVKEDDIRKHDMHTEFYQVSEEAAATLRKARSEHRRIIAIGTTPTRTLETVMQKCGDFKATSGNTNLFIYPGFKYKAIDCLITNFHLPKSTLVMLVSAFSSRDNILRAYKHAVDSKYRFFSFGDSMFIHTDKTL